MSSSPEFASGLPVPVSALQYRDMSARKMRDGVAHPEPIAVDDAVVKSARPQSTAERSLLRALRAKGQKRHTKWSRGCARSTNRS